ncbi:hypothetical protein ONE63_004463 [Megalurothrips usitatus]|uniref:AIMP2 thioredoxin-like domain-containing protein n=1 Tax=Megalurothrips usitatus TaxID=439358 RepID=A0AAV7X2W8_9NEOP|nr:hypothetical protein ONE63_004463 [Megalurothrips usitatus]
MSTCMYKLRPLVRDDDPLPAPTHDMYRMKPVQGGSGPAPTRAAPTGSKGDMAVLEGRQEDILRKLSKLRIDIEELRSILRQPSQVKTPPLSTGTVTCPPCPELGENRDIVLYASPEHPPYSILALARIWGASCPIQLTNHTHSSVQEAPAAAQTFCHSVTGAPRFNVTLVWKQVGAETELVINPFKFTTVRGETNILRFLSRVGPSNFAYESGSDLSRVAQFDEVLDNCQRLARSHTVKEKQAIIRTFNASLGKSEWIFGPQLSIADIAVWSVLKQQEPAAALTQTLSKWMERCNSMLL